MSTVDEATQTMIRNLEEKTGKSIAEWIKIVKKNKLTKHAELVGFLKSEYGMGHGYANLVVHTALRSSAAGADEGDLFNAQYAGAKAPLRALYDALMNAIEKFGNDIEITPKKAYVSLRRSKQFAIIQPSTATRMDVGINLKGVPPSGRLEASGSFSAMVTHRVRLVEKKDVDKELIDWLKQAYDAA